MTYNYYWFAYITGYMFAWRYKINNFLQINYKVTALDIFNMMSKFTIKLCKEDNVDPQ